jgi:CubicO group peptidase (beta-lactamase class C family)
MPDPFVEGFVAPGFEAVRAAFEGNLETGLDLGAGVAVYRDGEPVVDLCGGWRDAERTTPYDHETLQLVFSTTKGATAICVGILVDRGLLDYDAKVAEYWPEFAAAGKADITVAQLVSHQAGIPAVDAGLTLQEVLAWDPIVRALEEQAPYWPPGTAFGYHALTYGYLAGELVRRISGKPIGEFFAAEVARPLGIDFWIGLPEQEEPRVAPLVPPPPAPPEIAELMRAMIGPDTLGGKALSLGGAFGVTANQFTFNRRDVHAAEIPAANGITNARSLARMYSACIGEIDGVRLLSSEVVERARTTRTSGADKCLGFELSFGLGFMTAGPLTAMLGPGSFGHFGAGGSIGMARPETGVAVGYVMNTMAGGVVGDPRSTSLVDAVLASS